MAKEATKVVAKAPATGQVASYNYGQEAGAGFETTSTKDLSIPFLSVLQPMSPQIEEIEGAKSGQLFNTVTKELADGEKTGIVFIPCHSDTAYVEWIPRADGGGYVGSHAPDSDVVKEAIAHNKGNRFGDLKTAAGNELQETHYVYGLILDAEGKQTEGFAVISFTSTKIKPKRDWFTAMYTLKGQPPLFANRAKIKTVKQKNEHGTFYNFKIEPFSTSWKESLINPTDERYLLDEARDFREMVVNGIAKADFSQEKSTASTGSAPSGQVDEDGQEIPF